MDTHLAAYRIASDGEKQRPVDQWPALLAELPEHRREPVREVLKAMFAIRKENAALQAQIDAGQAVWIEIQDGGKA